MVPRFAMLPIVIVDDSTGDLELVRRALVGANVLNPLILVKGGQKCLDYFEGRNEFQDRQLPVLLILDLAMPDIDGVSVLRKLDGAEVSSGSVFVMLSGVSDLKLVQKGYQHGAVTFLIKPLQENEVLQMLDRIKGIQLKKSGPGYVVELEKSGRLFSK
jgi:CheY-like chemotaxis protein